MVNVYIGVKNYKLNRIMAERKYFLTSTNEEVHIGDTIRVTEQIEKFGCKGEVVFTFTLNEENIKQLVDSKILKVEAEPEVNLNFFIKAVSKRLLISEENFRNIMSVFNTNKVFIFSLLLKEMSLYFNAKRTKRPKVYYFISGIDGCIHSIDSNKVKNDKWVSLFKNPIDIIVSLGMLKGMHKELYPELYEQKDKERNPS